MANPRKFSEKIALQKQKQAEGTAEFERIMKEVYATKMDETQANQKILECCLVNDAGVVNAGSGAGSPVESVGAGGGGGGSNSPTSYRESRGRSVGVGPMRRPSERKQDRSPYGNNSANVGAMGLANNAQNTAYLSPPMDISWRRSNSDSALHQSLNMAVAAEGHSNYGLGDLPGIHGDLGTLHANYQHHNQRSHPPHIGRSYSPQAQRRKGGTLQQQNLHQQLQEQQHLRQMEVQQHQVQHQQHHHQQQPLHAQHFNAKIFNSNMPANSLFKTLQEQAMAIANTGSLPDLTSVRYAAPSQQLIQQQEQQLTLSPVLSPHSNNNSCSERDQSPSPFSTGNGGGPSSPYNQQQHSPTPATKPASVAQTSPHLSFTNLTVQSPRSPQQSAQTGGATYVHLPTLGAANSTGNLTDYRQPQNPPSPGSSPGLLTSGGGNDIHTSAPSSPVRHPQKQTPVQHQQQGYNTKAIQSACERYSDSSYNTLNHSFHNHFEQFSLGDGNSSPDQQRQHFQQQHNLYTSLEFDSFGASADGSCTGALNGQQHVYTQSLVQNKLLDFNSLNVLTGRSTSTALSINNEGIINTIAAVNRTCSNNNNQQQQQQLSGRTLATNQQQQLLNNNSSSSTNNSPTTNCRANNNASNFVTHQSDVSAVGPLPLGGLSPISSPLPIPSPLAAQNHPQQQHSFSLSHTHSAQHSPHHSPLHTAHHASPVSVSSPVLSTLGDGISPTAEASSNVTTAASVNHHPQHPCNAIPTSANIPSIIFSDYSSNSDFSREIFDTLDLDLGQMDVTGLQMLSDPSTIMIADPTIEDSFRRDLN